MMNKKFTTIIWNSKEWPAPFFLLLKTEEERKEYLDNVVSKKDIPEILKAIEHVYQSRIIYG